MKKKIAFIINPISGNKSKGKLPGIIDKYLDTEIFDYDIHFTEYRGHAKALAAQFAATGYYAVAAVGGDGTVNEVADALRHTDTVLAILPAGSGNGLARHLQIPMSVKKAVQRLNNAQITAIDYGLVNDKAFFCTCGTGFDAYVSSLFADSKHRGFQTYIAKVIVGYFQYKAEIYQLKGETIEWQDKAFLITFANAAQWGNNTYIAPHADMQDGLMDVAILRKLPFRAVPAIAIRLFTKSIDKSKLMTKLQTSAITLIREQAGPFHIDGEPCEMGRDISIQLVPKGLKILI